MSAPPTAFFDFDGTVIDGYSARAVLADRIRRGRLDVAEAGRLLSALLQSATGHDVVADYIVAEVRAMRSTPVEEIERLGVRLTRQVIGGWLHAEARELIEEHHRQGHRVVIASSALPFQVEPLARELGVDAVLCTRPAVEDGRYTGLIDGPVLWGAGKAQAVKEYAAREGIDLAECFAYANGEEDVDFLSCVGHPTAVNPDAALEAAAEAQGWPVRRFAPRPRAGLVAGARTVAAYAGLSAGVGVGAALGLLNGSRQQAANIAFSVGSDVGLSLAGVHLDVRGAENLWAARPAVFVFNHQSLLDGWVAINLLRRDFTGVGKKEMSRIPVLAQFAWLTNVALVDRSDPTQARAALEPALQRLREGYSIALAPEGTRSVTPRVGPFKKGAFHLAIQAGVPVVPMVIRNAGELQWRGSKLIRPGRIDVAVLPPIDVTGWAAGELDERVAEVRRLFVRALEDWDTATSGIAPSGPATSDTAPSDTAPSGIARPG